MPFVFRKMLVTFAVALAVADDEKKPSTARAYGDEGEGHGKDLEGQGDDGDDKSATHRSSEPVAQRGGADDKSDEHEKLNKLEQEFQSKLHPRFFELIESEKEAGKQLRELDEVLQEGDKVLAQLGEMLNADSLSPQDKLRAKSLKGAVEGLRQLAQTARKMHDAGDVVPGKGASSDAGDVVPDKGASSTGNSMPWKALLLAALAMVVAVAALALFTRASKAREFEVQHPLTELSLGSSATLP